MFMHPVLTFTETHALHNILGPFFREVGFIDCSCILFLHSQKQVHVFCSYIHRGSLIVHASCSYIHRIPCIHPVLTVTSHVSILFLHSQNNHVSILFLHSQNNHVSILFLQSHPMHASCSYIRRNKCMHSFLTFTESHVSILFLHSQNPMYPSCSYSHRITMYTSYSYIHRNPCIT